MRLTCQYSEPVDCDRPSGLWEVCLNDATLTCCDYGGHVCALHRCRCSKPLELPGDNPAIELGAD